MNKRTKDATKKKQPKEPPRIKPNMLLFLDFDEDVMLLVPFAVGEGGGEDNGARSAGGQKMIW
jgi:hypothetical protein